VAPTACGDNAPAESNAASQSLLSKVTMAMRPKWFALPIALSSECVKWLAMPRCIVSGSFGQHHDVAIVSLLWWIHPGCG
jgi:hypothetical protein